MPSHLTTSLLPRTTAKPAARLGRAGAPVLLALSVWALSACTVPLQQSGSATPPVAAVPAAPASLVAFTTQLRGANVVPPNKRQSGGSVDAVFDPNTRLLRWKGRFNGLSGPAMGVYFHGPAAIGANAGVALAWPTPWTAASEGRSTLTPAQAADLIAGRWYVSVPTARFPQGEVRGQMTVLH